MSQSIAGIRSKLVHTTETTELTTEMARGLEEKVHRTETGPEGSEEKAPQDETVQGGLEVLQVRCLLSTMSSRYYQLVNDAADKATVLQFLLDVLLYIPQSSTPCPGMSSRVSRSM